MLPLAAAVFLGWVLLKSLIAATDPELWSMVGIIVVGVILMVVARFGMRSSFFQIRRESEASAR